MIPTISIHAPLRGRLIPAATVRSDNLFQSTPPCGGDHFELLTLSRGSHFNPRPLAGATSLSVNLSRGIRFQSTPPCGGDIPPTIIFFCPRYFNPRPLAGATSFLRYSVWRGVISIHAPLRGRLSCLGGVLYLINFNPRPLAGATGGVVMVDLITLISIHAPLRGRLLLFRPAICTALFQSTPPCGGDKLSSSPTLTLLRFQSTPPCGGDDHYRNKTSDQSNFNPRPLAGATPQQYGCSPHAVISIHAPLRGRRSPNAGHAYNVRFQSTPPCGGDLINNPPPQRRKFQSTPPCGGDIQGRSTRYPQAISIHAPLRGRPYPHCSQCCMVLFQSTPPCGGDRTAVKF